MKKKTIKPKRKRKEDANMPLVSLLDLEKSLKINQFINQVNSNNRLLMASAAVAAAASSGAGSVMPGSISQTQFQQNHQNLINDLMQQNNLTVSAVAAAANNILLNMNLANQAAVAAASNNASKQINYSRYKTELCRQFSENGECKYGDKCQFAHGMNDLKDVNRHPKYKTDFCKTFHSKGFCPYGPRCHFIHDLNENFIEQQQQQLGEAEATVACLQKTMRANKLNALRSNSGSSNKLQSRLLIRITFFKLINCHKFSHIVYIF